MLRNIFQFLHSIPYHRRWLAALIVINGAGGLAGFAWYAVQLSQTPWYLWPVVPDSPLSVVLFTAYLVGFYNRKRWPVLAAAAQLTTFKYGLWTVVVLGGHMLQTGRYDFEFTYLSASHGFMALQAYLFMRADPQPVIERLIGGFWLIINDFFDYVIGMHPRIPDPEALPVVAVQAVLLTAGALTLAWWLSRRRPFSGHPDST
ncbi:MAG: DUF1405 domain-containing protein [Thermaerobacterales bacterium]